jgi:hypothetical protein
MHQFTFLERTVSLRRSERSLRSSAALHITSKDAQVSQPVRQYTETMIFKAVH